MARKKKGRMVTLERVLSRGMRSGGEILYKASKIGGKEFYKASKVGGKELYKLSRKGGKSLQSKLFPNSYQSAKSAYFNLNGPDFSGGPRFSNVGNNPYVSSMSKRFGRGMDLGNGPGGVGRAEGFEGQIGRQIGGSIGDIQSNAIAEQLEAATEAPQAQVVAEEGQMRENYNLNIQEESAVNFPAALGPDINSKYLPIRHQRMVPVLDRYGHHVFVSKEGRMLARAPDGRFIYRVSAKDEVGNQKYDDNGMPVYNVRLYARPLEEDGAKRLYNFEVVYKPRWWQWIFSRKAKIIDPATGKVGTESVRGLDVDHMANITYSRAVNRFVHVDYYNTDQMNPEMSLEDGSVKVNFYKMWRKDLLRGLLGGPEVTIKSYRPMTKGEITKYILILDPRNKGQRFSETLNS